MTSIGEWRMKTNNVASSVINDIKCGTKLILINTPEDLLREVNT